MGARSRKAGHKGGGHGGSQNQHKSSNSSFSFSSSKSPPFIGKSSFNRQFSNEKKDSSSYSISTLFGPWSPQAATAFKALLSARLCAAVWSNVSDCDETYNYWEPCHFLIHGNGFQTWEYSPVYAIRSYFYLWLYAFPTLIYTMLLQTNKVLVFYYTRCILAFTCALCETYFYKGLLRQFGPNIARLALCFLVISSGMFVASTAFLPSSFSMYMTMLAYGAWFQQHYRIVILASGMSALVGWPFSALIVIPILVDLLMMKKKRLYFVKWGLIIGLAIAIPLISVDSYYYGKLVIAPLNIILYNVFSSHGANLYGTEPWTYYFVNCFLNFNLVFVVSLLALPIMLLCKFVIKSKRNIVNSSHWICLGSLYLWFIVFFPQAHKEERFLFPSYPLLCLCAAFVLEMVHKAITNILPKLSHFYSMIILLFIFLFALMSISRCLALYKGYHAPMDTYMELGRLHQEYNVSSLKNPINVCVGKEWHRFPNSFFIPDHKHWKLQFVKSDFGGQLPKPYSEEPGASRIIPTDMNEMNREEPSRYVNVSSCHFLVDSDHQEHSPLDPPYSRGDNWEIVFSYSFLDNKNSPQLWRAFYVPFITEYKCVYVKYNLLKNKYLTFE